MDTMTEKDTSWVPDPHGLYSEAYDRLHRPWMLAG